MTCGLHRRLSTSGAPQRIAVRLFLPGCISAPMQNEVGTNRLIYLDGSIFRNSQFRDVPMILDTGASSTAIHTDYLTWVGYDLKRDSIESENLVCANGLLRSSRIKLDKFIVLGQTILDFKIITYKFPSQTMIGGILGNDFLQDYCLFINFPPKWLEIKKEIKLNFMKEK